jgi:hypothetical protein
VVGAANYIQSPNSTDGEMHFCTATPCMDANYTGDEEAGGPFKNELARFESLFFDAFDRSDSSLRFTLFPGNADVWEQILTNDPRNPGGTQLIPSAFPYITNQDEFISLSGLAWRNWTQHWLARGKTPTHSHVVGGLVDSIKAHGYDWCDICDMLALHDKNTPEAARPFTSDVSFPAPTFTQRFDRWRVCQNSDEINDWLGPPPNEFLNLDARCVPCPLHQFVDATGACQPCPAGSVARGNTCSSCAPGNPSETADVCVVP